MKNLITMEKFNISLKKLIKETQSDFFIFVGTINDSNADKFINLLRRREVKEVNCSLILTTYGGDPDAGYRIIRAIKRYYEKLSIYVFGFCKSTGTLMTLGADEVIMSDFGEFGPLDIQLTKDDELSNTSGLNFVQSLTFLNEQLFRSFEENFLSLKRASQNTITTKTAADIASRLSVGLISPISGQIDPVKLGEVQRSIRIANDYGTRLCENDNLIARLIVAYPSHGFVIDYQEASELFTNVRWVNDDESIIEQYLHKIVRSQSENNIIDVVEPIEENDKKNVEVEEKVIDLKPENENIEKNENINKNGTTKKARKAE